MKYFFDVVNPTLVGIVTLDILIIAIVYLILVDVARIDKSKKGAKIIKFHNSSPPIHIVWKSLLYICAVYFFIYTFYEFYSSMYTMFKDESLEGAINALSLVSFSPLSYIALAIAILWPLFSYIRTMYLAKKGKIILIEPERRLFSTKDSYEKIGKKIILLIITSCILGILI